MSDPTLFNVEPGRDVPAGEWRRSDPLTSVEAAQRITGRTEQQLLEVFRTGGTWTADELCHALPSVFPATLKSAVPRLASHELIVATGETRLSDRGCPMTVYRLPAAP